jgi:hypothetical protein
MPLCDRLGDYQHGVQVGAKHRGVEQAWANMFLVSDRLHAAACSIMKSSSDLKLPKISGPYRRFMLIYSRSRSRAMDFFVSLY